MCIHVVLLVGIYFTDARIARARKICVPARSSVSVRSARRDDPVAKPAKLAKPPKSAKLATPDSLVTIELGSGELGHPAFALRCSSRGFCAPQILLFLECGFRALRCGIRL